MGGGNRKKPVPDSSNILGLIAATTNDEPQRNRRGGGGGKKKKMNQKQILREMFCFSNEITDDSVVSLSPPRSGGGCTAAAAFARPKNDSQWRYMNLLENPAQKIVIATGPAGTGKTLFATEYAVRQYMCGGFDRIIFTRPSVSVDEDLGYLPGDINQKMAPWMRPLYDILYSHFSVKEVEEMVSEKIIEICPLGFMRGRTFKQCCIICDEMQNSTVAQMKMLLTRIGEGSRLIITGDLDQSDRVSSSPASENGLEDFMTRFRRVRSNSISSVEFDAGDIEREPVVREVLDIYGESKKEDVCIQNPL